VIPMQYDGGGDNNVANSSIYKLLVSHDIPYPTIDSMA
jgi:hypothetical protein